MKFASSHVKLNIFRFDDVAVFTCELKFEHARGKKLPHVNWTFSQFTCLFFTYK